MRAFAWAGVESELCTPTFLNYADFVHESNHVSFPTDSAPVAVRTINDQFTINSLPDYKYRKILHAKTLPHALLVHVEAPIYFVAS
jgi:hypothetical protein